MNKNQLISFLQPSRINRDPASPEFQRMLQELDIFDANSSLYITTEKLLNFPKKRPNNHPNSFLMYALGITEKNCDFNHPTQFRSDYYLVRYSPPDIDSDFEDRDLICDYLVTRYGRARVANIITYSEPKVRAALQSASKYLKVQIPGLSVNETAMAISKTVPEKANKKFEDALAIPEVHNLSQQFPRLFQVAQQLLSIKTHVGVHASAVVVSDEDITEVTPLQKASKCDFVTQLDMWDLENLGLIKFDILGLKTLRVMHIAMDMIKARNNGFEPDIWNLDIKDPNVIGLCANSLTNGIFQFESPGMKKLMQTLQVSSFDDLVAASALYRPGPLENGFHEMYGERKSNPQLSIPPHPALEEILRPTLGIFVYQEQLMKATQVLAGFSYTESDQFRKIIGKKKLEELPALMEKFLSRCASYGVCDAQTARIIWDQMEKFGSYCFNLSHSVAYTYVSYISAYLKVYFPMEFFCGLMTVTLKYDSKSDENLPKYEKEAKDYFKLTILPVDVNKSRDTYVIEDNKLRRPIGYCKGIGDEVQRTVCSQQPFKTPEEYIYKCEGTAVSEGVINILLEAGSFDSFGSKEEVSKKLKEAKHRKSMLKSSAKDNTAYIPNLSNLFKKRS